MESKRPLVSFFVVAYKQEQFIREAIRGAVSQTYEPLEIILSDDCSPDRTFEIMEEEAKAYHGPHTIVLNRNESNLGLAEHLNRVYAMAKGAFFIASAGDDVSVPERTEVLVARWADQTEPVDLVCSYFEEINASSKATGFVRNEVVFTPDATKPVRQWRCGATGACIGYDRKLYDKFGPLDPRIIAEDWVLAFRAWVGKGIAVVKQPLVKHRTHGQNLSELHRDVKREHSHAERRYRRALAAADRLACVQDWHRSWNQSGKADAFDVEKPFIQWIRLLQYNVDAYDCGRLGALLLALKALFSGGGVKNSFRMIVRTALRWQ